MSIASNATPSAGSAASSAAPRRPRQRDIRLDFFRGIGMFIIFMAHLPFNSWNAFIPARFGFSDATEIFVFCSGMASAIAFGRLFSEQGFGLGLSRIAYRCWQVYWAHICIFFLVSALIVVGDAWLQTNGAYTRGLNLVPFLSGDTGTNLVGLLTLTYVPNYFDILPMYLVILTLIPVVMALSQLGRVYVFAFVVGLWLLATFGFLDLPAEPWSERVWFFNPFAWQLVFFTGFAFMRGWITAPPVNLRLIIVAALGVLVTVPFATAWFLENFAVFSSARAAIEPLIDKTHFGILRYVHFLCLAYLAYALAGENGDNLRAIRGPLVPICCTVGQQALGVFMAGQFLAMLFGMVLDQLGHTFLLTAFVNIFGFALLVWAAQIAAYFKSAPWLVKSKKVPPGSVAETGVKSRAGEDEATRREFAQPSS